MSKHTDRENERDLARGAGLAGVARLGSLIEIVSQPLLIWLFGLPAFGLYISLWAGIVLASTILDFAMTSSLQRLLPQLEERESHAVLKLAILAPVGAATVTAAMISLNADSIAMQLSTASADRASLPTTVAIFAWALPLWMFIEVATSAMRARRAFGPEIRLRVFWEQIARMSFAVLFLLAGADEFGLVAAHLASLTLTAAMCIPLLGRSFDLPGLIREPISRETVRLVFVTGGSLLPSNIARRALIHGPALMLNLMLPGQRGAEAAGLFEIARRISTVPYFIRQSFEYVLAPLSSAGARAGRAEVMQLYHMATRIITALVLPLSALIIFSGRDILSIYRPEVISALPLLVILVLGRAVDAVAGPAQSVVEMTGNRGLPLLNSVLGITVWLLLLAMLVPTSGAIGMAIAVAAGTVTAAWAGVLELGLRRGEGTRRRLLNSMVVTIGGAAIMAVAALSLPGVLRFGALLLVWLSASWLALRWGLNDTDKQSFDPAAKWLKLR